MFRTGGRGRPGGETPDSLVPVLARRIGIEKRGDAVALFVSLEGEPLHQFGPPVTLHLDEPFDVGIGFCSHLPDKSDTAVLSNVVLENAAGRIRWRRPPARRLASAGLPAYGRGLHRRHARAPPAPLAFE